MPNSSRRRLLSALALSPLSIWGSSVLAASPSELPVVLLKLDDVVELRQNGLSDAWKRVLDFLENEGIAASLGIIGESLEDPSARYISDLTAVARNPRYQIWNHGYPKRFIPNVAAGEKSSNVGPSAEDQFAAIQKTQSLIASRLGVTSELFGPHDSATDDNTYIALSRIPEIRSVWFYAPRQPGSLFVFKREANMEQPIFQPNLAGLQNDLTSRPLTRPYLALQGHPDMWNADRFQAFVSVVRWLAAQGHTFMRATDYLHSR